MNNVVYSIIGVNKISWFDQYFGKVCLLHYSPEFICASIGIVCLRDYVAPLRSDAEAAPQIGKGLIDLPNIG